MNIIGILGLLVAMGNNKIAITTVISIIFCRLVFDNIGILVHAL